MIGEPVEFEVSSADASTAVPFVIRAAGSRATRTLAANEMLLIQSFTAFLEVGDGSNSARVIADTDGDGDYDAGDLIAAFGEGPTAADFCGTGNGICGAPGVVPKVLAAAAGQIDLAGVGVIVKV